VKLLFDENLAPSLVELLADIYPQSAHVRDLGLKSAADAMVWDYAAQTGYAIVTRTVTSASGVFSTVRHQR
jgi:predicted nuclease of predicted toxin-antitoxin system